MPSVFPESPGTSSQLSEIGEAAAFPAVADDFVPVAFERGDGIDFLGGGVGVVLTLQ